MLIGYNRTGLPLLKALDKVTEKYLVLDFNPEVINSLKREGKNCIYGDADDSEFLDMLKIYKSKLVVSTVPDVNTNLLVLHKIRKKNRHAVVIVTSRQITEALRLYNAGADYVILPHFLGGRYAARMIEEFRLNRGRYREERAGQIEELKERAEAGQEHPEVEREIE